MPERDIWAERDLSHEWTEPRDDGQAVCLACGVCTCCDFDAFKPCIPVPVPGVWPKAEQSPSHTDGSPA